MSVKSYNLSVTLYVLWEPSKASFCEPTVVQSMWGRKFLSKSCQARLS